MGCSAPASFRPSRSASCATSTRQRSQLVGERASVSNRIQKVLEDANIKLASVASEVLGVSGRAMITALIGGETEPDRLADLARRRLRGKIPQLRQALKGHVTDHHRFMLRTLMDHVGHLDDLIARLDRRIEEVMSPFALAVERLVTIPGVNHRAAEVIVAEIGTDMTKFPSAGHLSSWAGMCPGNHQSAGKRRAVAGRPRGIAGCVRCWCKCCLGGRSHTKKTLLSATYQRWVKRMGKKRALRWPCRPRQILVLIYELLKDQTTYQERLVPDQAA